MWTSKMESMLRFSLTEDRKLVKMVAACPALWDARRSDFTHHGKRDKMWKTIAQEMKRPEKQCRIRWRSIRDNYRRQKKLEKNSVTESMDTKKRASYWSWLGFLDTEYDELPIYQNSQPSTNMDVGTTSDIMCELEDDPLAINGDEADAQEIEAENKSVKVEKFNICGKLENSNEICFAPVPKQEKSESTLYESEDDPLAVNSDIETGTQKVEPEDDKLVKADQLTSGETENRNDDVCFVSIGFEHKNDESSNAIIKHLKIRLEEKLQIRKRELTKLPEPEPDGEDEIDLFFKAMAATVKKFRPADRTEAKNRIFRVVSELEMRGAGGFV